MDFKSLPPDIIDLVLQNLPRKYLRALFDDRDIGNDAFSTCYKTIKVCSMGMFYEPKYENYIHQDSDYSNSRPFGEFDDTFCNKHIVFRSIHSFLDFCGRNSGRYRPHTLEFCSLNDFQVVHQRFPRVLEKASDIRLHTFKAELLHEYPYNITNVNIDDSHCPGMSITPDLNWDKLQYPNAITKLQILDQLPRPFPKFCSSIDGIESLIFDGCAILPENLERLPTSLTLLVIDRLVDGDELGGADQIDFTYLTNLKSFVLNHTKDLQIRLPESLVRLNYHASYFYRDILNFEDLINLKSFTIKDNSFPSLSGLFESKFKFPQLQELKIECDAYGDYDSEDYDESEDISIEETISAFTVTGSFSFPDSLEVLELHSMNIILGEGFEFPKNLKKLLLLGAKSNDEHCFELPQSLKHLSIWNPTLDLSKVASWPPALNSLVLNFNNLLNLCDIDLQRLHHLESFIFKFFVLEPSSKIKVLLPPNLKHLELSQSTGLLKDVELVIDIDELPISLTSIEIDDRIFHNIKNFKHLENLEKLLVRPAQLFMADSFVELPLNLLKLEFPRFCVPGGSKTIGLALPKLKELTLFDPYWYNNETNDVEPNVTISLARCSQLRYLTVNGKDWKFSDVPISIREIELKQHHLDIDLTHCVNLKRIAPNYDFQKLPLNLDLLPQDIVNISCERYQEVTGEFSRFVNLKILAFKELEEINTPWHLPEGLEHFALQLFDTDSEFHIGNLIFGTGIQYIDFVNCLVSDVELINLVQDVTTRVPDFKTIYISYDGDHSAELKPYFEKGYLTDC